MIQKAELLVITFSFPNRHVCETRLLFFPWWENTAFASMFYLVCFTWLYANQTSATSSASSHFTVCSPMCIYMTAGIRWKLLVLIFYFINRKMTSLVTLEDHNSFWIALLLCQYSGIWNKLQTPCLWTWRGRLPILGWSAEPQDYKVLFHVSQGMSSLVALGVPIPKTGPVGLSEMYCLFRASLKVVTCQKEVSHRVAVGSLHTADSSLEKYGN